MSDLNILAILVGTVVVVLIGGAYYGALGGADGAAVPGL